MGDVAGVFQGLIGFCGDDESLLFGCSEYFIDGSAFFGWQVEAFSQALVRHVVVHEILFRKYLALFRFRFKVELFYR